MLDSSLTTLIILHCGHILQSTSHKKKQHHQRDTQPDQEVQDIYCYQVLHRRVFLVTLLWG